MDWRQNIGADSLLDSNVYTPPEVLEDYFHGGICGYDKGGNPIWMDLIPNVDFPGTRR